MFNYDDLLIIGDSFAKNRDHQNDWPKLLCKLLTNSENIPRGCGFSGASWWSVRKELLKELEIKVPKILIICHTEATRIPSDFDFGINAASATVASTDIVIPFGQHKNFLPDIKKAAKEFYTFLISYDYMNWAQYSWYRELEILLEKINVPYVVHLHCFPPGYNQQYLHRFTYGMTVSTPLWDLCQNVDQGTARNHFTKEQNVKIAHAINRLILTNPPYSHDEVCVKLI